MNQQLTLTISVNDREITRTAPAHHTLLRWLRDAGVWDVRYGCGEGVCGACTVMVDGRVVSGCLVLAAQVADCRIQTAAGLAQAESVADLKHALIEHGAVQCGFCTSGMFLAGCELLDSAEPLDRDQVVRALEGNLCRCTGYQGIVEAVLETAARRAER